MRVVSLQSGSNGNCYVVEGGGVRVIVDAGISGRRALDRLAERGIDIHDADALLLSHDHRDHARCAGIYQRKFGVDLHATTRTLETAQRRMPLGRMGAIHTFAAGQTLRFGDLKVETVATPHDGVEPVTFIFDDGHSRLGILTDLGCVFDRLGDAIASLDAVILESNYDDEMLSRGPYPAFLKRRIRGDGGHISNRESAELIRDAAEGMQWVALAHLSEQNNTPALALETYRSVVGPHLPLHVAGRHAATDILEV